jgi:hydrogenase nickel incorporation protein HypB
MCKSTTEATPDLDQLISVERRLIGKNDALASRNRDWFERRSIVALNLVSSPGAGKTSLLERTIADLHEEFSIHVIEGDQATDYDAQRIESSGARAIQIHTGSGCHLDAAMIANGLPELDPPKGSLVFIENVGNLVCPALFDLGEAAKVEVCSVAEGDDKLIKYPQMFRVSLLMIINKMDLLPHVRFDVDRCVRLALEVNPRLEVIAVSATSGSGLATWYDWLRAHSPVRASAIRTDHIPVAYVEKI